MDASRMKLLPGCGGHRMDPVRSDRHVERLGSGGAPSTLEGAGVPIAEPDRYRTISSHRAAAFGGPSECARRRAEVRDALGASSGTEAFELTTVRVDLAKDRVSIDGVNRCPEATENGTQ